MASTPFERALAAIDAAHAADPTTVTVAGAQLPYELHYAQKSTAYLRERMPAAPPTLQLAVRAQHFRRWETPRASYPATRSGYLRWRAGLKTRQAAQVEALLAECGYGAAETARVGALMRKEGLEADEETQALEDVACLVFLDDQFAEFEKGHDEEKILGILRKTWGKMSERGREMALQMEMDGRPAELVKKALEGA